MTTLLHEGPTILQWGVVLSASCAAGLIDLRTREIPNLLTFPMLLGGYAAAAVAGGLSGLADAGMASVLLSAPYVLLFVFAGGGAGDAKVMAAIGAWLGVVNGTIVLLSVAIAGAIVASIVLIMHAWRGRKVSEHRLAHSYRAALKFDIPYGVAVWAGVWVAAAGVFVWL